MGLEGHPLYDMLPEVTNTRYQLTWKSTVKPKVLYCMKFLRHLNFAILCFHLRISQLSHDPLRCIENIFPFFS